MSWLDDLVRKAAGATGKAIDVVGSSVGKLNPNQSFGNNPWVDVSSTLQNWAGNPGSTLKSAIVKPARASDTTSYYPPDVNVDNSGGTVLGLNTDQEINWNGTPTSGNGGGNGGGTVTDNGGGGGVDLEGILARQRQRNSSLIDSWLSQAGGIRDEIKGMTQKKRGQYADMRNEGDVKINDTFEGEKGNARRTAQDLASIEGNRARALGLGGSATDYAASRRGEELGRTLGNTNTVKSENTMENKRLYDTRIDQADAWDRQADRDYQTAGLKAGDAKNSMLNTEEGTLMGWLGNILNNQLALNATKSGINSEVVNPYAVDTSKIANYLTSTLSGGAPEDSGTTNDGVNLDNSTLMADQLKKKKNNSLYGYPAYG